MKRIDIRNLLRGLPHGTRHFFRHCVVQRLQSHGFWYTVDGKEMVLEESVGVKKL